MKRFFFICVALIAFASANASGTNYQPTDQLQTCYQMQHPIVLLPAINVAEFAFEAPAIKAIKLITPADWKVQGLFKPLVYHNPDYGLNSYNRFVLINSYCSINSHTKTNCYNLKNSNHKLPTQFVQLE